MLYFFLGNALATSSASEGPFLFKAFFLVFFGFALLGFVLLVFALLVLEGPLPDTVRIPKIFEGKTGKKGGFEI